MVEVEYAYYVVYAAFVDRYPGECSIFHNNVEDVFAVVFYVYGFHVHAAGHRFVCGNIQEIFSSDAVVAITDPVYPVYLDTNVMAGRTGALGADEALPSIRSLAKDLRISVITTKRAYEELEQEGFLYTVAGKGCFVAEKNTELLREEDLRRIEEHLSEIRRLAARCGLTRSELREMLEIMEEDEA